MDFSFAGEATPRAKAYTQLASRGVQLRNRIIGRSGHIIGKPIRLATKGVSSVGGVAAHGAGRAAAYGAKGLIGIAARAPLATGLGVASLGMFSGSGEATVNQASQNAVRAVRDQARHFMKVSHMIPVPADDVSTYISVRTQLEKQAARAPRHLRPLDRIYQNYDRAARTGFRNVVDAVESTESKASEKVRRALSEQRIGGKDGYSPAQLIGAGILLGSGAAMAGFAGDAVGKGVGELGDLAHRLGRNRHYNAMLKADPELRQYDLDEVRKVFNVIHRASPYVSKEPLLAASTVRSILDTPRASHTSRTPVVSPEAIDRILSLEAGRQGTRYPFMQEVKNRSKADLKSAHNILG